MKDLTLGKMLEVLLEIKFERIVQVAMHLDWKWNPAFTIEARAIRVSRVFCNAG